MIGALSLLAATPAGGMDIWTVFIHAGPMAFGVLALLAAMSLASWAVMINKVLAFRRADAHSRRFLELFRNSKRFSEVNAGAGKLFASPLVGLFQAGYVEVDAQVKLLAETSGAAPSRYRIKSLEGVERSLRRALHAELQLLSRGTAFLATTASASPFIGLLGTVWGIMVAFNDIGRTGSTSIVAVAPGIAEALVNTAAGLVAAIPALVGYNYLGNRIRRTRSEMEDFAMEFLNLTERNFT